MRETEDPWTIRQRSVKYLAESLIASLPEVCADLELVASGRGRDHHVAARIVPRREGAAPLILYVYRDVDTLEVSTGRGSSFLFEDWGGEISCDSTAYASALRVARAVMKGRLTETVTSSDEQDVALEATVETVEGTITTRRVWGRLRKDAKSRTYDYAPYC